MHFRSGAERTTDYDEIRAWEEFFKIFDDNELAFLHQHERPGGKTSRFFKFVNRKSLRSAGV